MDGNSPRDDHCGLETARARDVDPGSRRVHGAVDRHVPVAGIPSTVDDVEEDARGRGYRCRDRRVARIDAMAEDVRSGREMGSAGDVERVRKHEGLATGLITATPGRGV